MNSLMYHDVLSDPGNPDTSGFPGEDAATYKVSADSFESHLNFLSEHMESKPISLRETNELQSLDSSDAWCISFDDGGISAELAADALEARDWRGHFFITTERIGQPGFLSEDQVRELHARGHVIGSHSHTHPPRISALSSEGVLDEWRRSVEILQAILGEEAALDVASVPGGFYSPEVGKAAAEIGIGYLFTSEPVSRIETIGDCVLLGRYSIRHNTTPERSAALAQGAWGPTTSMQMHWAARAFAKRFAGKPYEKLRKLLLSR